MDSKEMLALLDSKQSGHDINHDWWFFTNYFEGKI